MIRFVSLLLVLLPAEDASAFFCGDEFVSAERRRVRSYLRSDEPILAAARNGDFRVASILRALEYHGSDPKEFKKALEESAATHMFPVSQLWEKAPLVVESKLYIEELKLREGPDIRKEWNAFKDGVLSPALITPFFGAAAYGIALGETKHWALSAIFLSLASIQINTRSYALSNDPKAYMENIVPVAWKSDPSVREALQNRAAFLAVWGKEMSTRIRAKEQLESMGQIEDVLENLDH